MNFILSITTSNSTSPIFFSFIFYNARPAPSLFILSLISAYARDSSINENTTANTNSTSNNPLNKNPFNNNQFLAPKIRKRRQTNNNVELTILQETPVFELDLTKETELELKITGNYDSPKNVKISIIGQKPIGFKINNKRKSLIYKPPSATKQFSPFSNAQQIDQFLERLQNFAVIATIETTNSNNLIGKSNNLIGNSAINTPTIKSEPFYPIFNVCPCGENGNCNKTENVNGRFNEQSCDCQPAWDGDFCLNDKKSCESKSCYPGVECIDASAPEIGFSCGECPENMVGNGKSCINTCQIRNDLENNRVIYASGEEITKNDTKILPGEKLRYVCNPGFTPENAEDALKFVTCGGDGEFEPMTALKCVDVDECMENVSNSQENTQICDENSMCQNTIGSYVCTCLENYSGKPCMPVVELIDISCEALDTQTISVKWLLTENWVFNDKIVDEIYVLWYPNDQLDKDFNKNQEKVGRISELLDETFSSKLTQAKLTIKSFDFIKITQQSSTNQTFDISNLDSFQNYQITVVVKVGDGVIGLRPTRTCESMTLPGTPSKVFGLKSVDDDLSTGYSVDLAWNNEDSEEKFIHSYIVRTQAVNFDRCFSKSNSFAIEKSRCFKQIHYRVVLDV